MLDVLIHNDRKIGTNWSKLGSNCQIMIDPAKMIFRYGSPYIFAIIILYSVEVISNKSCKSVFWAWKSIYFFQCNFVFSRSNQYANTNSKNAVFCWWGSFTMINNKIKSVKNKFYKQISKKINSEDVSNIFLENEKLTSVISEIWQ